MDWHAKKATENKKLFYGFQTVIIITAALIPIINLIDFASFETRVISSILGGVVVGVTSILQLKKHHENWIQYRSTEELLKREKYLFECEVGPYDNLDEKERCKKLVERIESTLSNQNDQFFSAHQEHNNSTQPS